MWFLLACTESSFVALDAPPEPVPPGFGAPDAPESEVATPVESEPERGRLAVWPADVDLTVAPGCPATRTLTLQNTGGAPVQVTSIDHRFGDAYTIDAPALPLVLGPGAQVTVDVVFEGADPGDYDGQINVYADDALAVHRADQHVRVGAVGARSERFVQGPFDGVDVVLTLDETASMGGTRGGLAAQFSEFVDTLAASGVDWRMAVVTGDDGCANEGVLAPDRAGLLSVFSAAARVSAGDVNYGYGDYGATGWLAEAGLTLARNALDQSRSGACNQDLLGPDALTAVITVSDERDQSALAWDALVDQIEQRRPASVIHAIAGDVPDGCAHASAGRGYAEASAATSGLFLSVCDGDRAFAWRTLADVLVAQVSDPRSSFALAAGAPEDGSLVVTVNGAPADGWAYDATANAVVFQVPPPPHAVLVITYADTGTCGG